MQHPHLPTLTAYPTHLTGGNPYFFHQNERKRYKKNRLPKSLGSVAFSFLRSGKKRGGLQQPPGYRRGLMHKAAIF